MSGKAFLAILILSQITLSYCSSHKHKKREIILDEEKAKDRLTQELKEKMSSDDEFRPSDAECFRASLRGYQKASYMVRESREITCGVVQMGLEMAREYFEALGCWRGFSPATFELRRRKLLKPFFTCKEVYGNNTPCTIFFKEKLEDREALQAPSWIRCSPEQEFKLWYHALESCPRKEKDKRGKNKNREESVLVGDFCKDLEALAKKCLAQVERCYAVETQEGHESMAKYGADLLALGLERFAGHKMAHRSIREQAYIS